MLVIRHRGDFKKTERFLSKMKRINFARKLEPYAKEGVSALASFTPIDSGLTAGSWNYNIEVTKDSFSIAWTNSNIQNGVSIAIILQYGHATGTGGYVQGQDYINPALKPIFNKIAKEVWQEVKRS